MKHLTTKPNELGIGIDVGWHFTVPDVDEPYEVWWGNTRDVNSLASLVDDIFFKGYEFQLDGTTITYLSSPERKWTCVTFEEGLA